MKIYKFRNCLLNLTERRALKDGKYLELTPKTFDVLRLLVERCGEVVTKDEILGEVWNGSFVEEGNLPVHISKLRRLLDSSKNEPFIETAQGSGYRFVASVNTVSDEEWRKQLPPESHLHNDKTSGEFLFDSIAVLPLENESRDPEIDYLADGLTESFINNFSRIPGLKVIARNTVFRYKNKNADSKEVGETLGIATVLTGRIRVIKDNLTISVELIKVADGTQIWGTKLNHPFSDIVEVQEKITFAVSEQLRSEIGNLAKKSANPITNNAESYRLYLKGKYLLEKWTKTEVHKAIECFVKSVSFDPVNVHSYTEIIECYFSLYFSDYISYSEVLIKIKPLLSILSKLNQNVDVVQVMHGRRKMYLEWKFEAAEKHFQYALTLNPNCLIARHCYSDLLVISERFSEALKEFYQTTLIDPLSLYTYKRTGRLFYKMGQFENALIYLKDALELEPNDYVTLTTLGTTLTEMGFHDEALEILHRSQLIQFNIETLSMIGSVNARAGRKGIAYQVIEQIKSASTPNCQHSIKLARIYLDLGEKEKAYNFLEKAINEHEVDIIAIKLDPRWTSLRDESRFKELVLRIGIPKS